jgi:uncharacterized protein YbaR (Trm112 family)
MRRARPVWVDVLVCPECRGVLREVGEGLVCERDGRLYPVVDGVPHMTLEEAVPWMRPPPREES